MHGLNMGGLHTFFTPTARISVEIDRAVNTPQHRQCCSKYLHGKPGRSVEVVVESLLKYLPTRTQKLYLTRCAQPSRSDVPVAASRLEPIDWGGVNLPWPRACLIQSKPGLI